MGDKADMWANHRAFRERERSEAVAAAPALNWAERAVLDALTKEFGYIDIDGYPQDSAEWHRIAFIAVAAARGAATDNVGHDR